MSFTIQVHWREYKEGTAYTRCLFFLLHSCQILPLDVGTAPLYTNLHDHSFCCHLLLQTTPVILPSRNHSLWGFLKFAYLHGAK